MGNRKLKYLTIQMDELEGQIESSWKSLHNIQ